MAVVGHGRLLQPVVCLGLGSLLSAFLLLEFFHSNSTLVMHGQRSNSDQNLVYDGDDDDDDDDEGDDEGEAEAAARTVSNFSPITNDPSFGGKASKPGDKASEEAMEHPNSDTWVRLRTPANETLEGIPVSSGEFNGGGPPSGEDREGSDDGDPENRVISESPMLENPSARNATLKGVATNATKEVSSHGHEIRTREVRAPASAPTPGDSHAENSQTEPQNQTHSSIHVASAATTPKEDGAAATMKKSETTNSTESSNSSSSENTNEKELLAACFVGGLRTFELTGPTIIRHILGFYKPRAIFVNLPLDKDSHKIALILKTSFSFPVSIVINVVIQGPIREDGAARRVLTEEGSPNKLQGLLQYFELVEGCASMIEEFQTKNNLTFSHILRTRPDSFWTSEPPTLSSFPKETFVTPRGSQFAGLNDRFAISNYELGMIGLRRQSILNTIDRYRFKYHAMNSEKCLKAQLDLHQKPHVSIDLPFCVLSMRSYPWPPGPQGIPVLSITTQGMMNGAKCRPCVPIATGIESYNYLRSLSVHWSGVAENYTDLDLCLANRKWTPGWENIFDQVVGNASAKIRQTFASRTYQTCLEDLKLPDRDRVLFHGPPISVLCALGSFGNYEPIGNRNHYWMVLTKALTSSSVVYSFGIQKNMDWEAHLTSKLGCITHSFDCTPFGYSWVQSNLKISNSMRVYDICIGFRDGYQAFNEIRDWKGAVLGYSMYPKIFSRYFSIGKVELGKTKRFEPIMKGMNHQVLDLLRIDMNLDFVATCLANWAKDHSPLPVCQMLISFEAFGLDLGSSLKTKCIEVLGRRGMHLTKCFGVYGLEKCHFLSIDYCKF